MVKIIGEEEMAEELSSRSLFLTSVEAGLMLLLNILSLLGNLLTCIAVYMNSMNEHEFVSRLWLVSFLLYR